MEYQSPSFSILVPTLLFVFITLKLWKTLKITSHSTSNLPPGPWKLPLIGNLHLLAGSLPHHCMRDLAKKYGAIMHLQLGEVSHVVISSPETAKEILKHHDISFADRPRLLAARYTTYNYTDIAFAPYGDYWRQLRKICTLELLTAKRVRSFRSIREEEVSNLMRSISSTAALSINLTEMLYTLTNDITARAVFGGKCKDQEAFILASQILIELGAGFSLADAFPSIKLLEVLSGMKSVLEKQAQEVDKIFDNIITEHRACMATRKTGKGETDDLVHVLLNLLDQENLKIPLTSDNIKSVILDLFVAGTETSSTTLVWAVSEMLKNPRVLEKAQVEVRQVFGGKGNVDEAGLHELKYLNMVIKETFRLHPPIPLLLPRECRESCKINGYDIPIGSKIIVNAWAIGRDPNYWTEAETFYPERFFDSSIDYKGAHFELIPFGAGRRICPGISFGMANVELPLANLLYYFDWKLPNGVKNEDLDMTEKFGGAVKRRNDLYLIPIPYHPPPSK